MPNRSSRPPRLRQPSTCSEQPVDWHTFPEILQRLHREGIYIHPNQLAEFMLCHGLPVDLTYVPSHLKQRAMKINMNYRGDMAALEAVDDLPQLFLFE